MAPIASGHRGARQKGARICLWLEGKGSTVHLVTEGNGLPLAFLVTAANVSEVTLGVTVLYQDCPIFVQSLNVRG